MEAALAVTFQGHSTAGTAMAVSLFQTTLLHALHY